MKIVLNADGPHIVEPEDLKSFAIVVVESCEMKSFAEGSLGMRGAGQLSHDGNHAFIEPEWIREQLGELAGDPRWSSDFEAMIAFATKKGWVDEQGRIRGHLERA